MVPFSVGIHGASRAGVPAVRIVYRKRQFPYLLLMIQLLAGIKKTGFWAVGTVS